MLSSGKARLSASGKYEALNARLFILALVVVAVFGLVIVGLIASNQDKQEQITYLQTNRLMYAYPNEDGVYVSSEKRPASVVERVAESVINNLYVYDKNSAPINFKAAAKEINPKYAVSFAERQNNKIESIRAQALSSMLTVQQQFDLVETPKGYVYEMTGLHEVYASRTFVESHLVRIRVELRKVVPTEARPLGLWVESIKEVQKSRVK